MPYKYEIEVANIAIHLLEKSSCQKKSKIVCTYYIIGAKEDDEVLEKHK